MNTVRARPLSPQDYPNNPNDMKIITGCIGSLLCLISIILLMAGVTLLALR